MRSAEVLRSRSQRRLPDAALPDARAEVFLADPSVELKGAARCSLLAQPRPRAQRTQVRRGRP